MTLNKPVEMFCTRCGSTEVVRDAWAEWNKQRQDWVLKTIFDNSRCDACGAANCIEERSPDTID